MSDTSNILDRFDECIRTLEELGPLLKQAGLGAETPAYEDALSTLKRIRKSTVHTVIQDDVTRMRLVFKTPGA